MGVNPVLVAHGLRVEKISLKMTKIANGKYFSFIIRSMKIKMSENLMGNIYKTFFGIFFYDGNK